MAIATSHSQNSDLDNNNHAANRAAHAWLVCMTAALFFFYEFMQMNMFNTLNDPLRQAFSLTASEVNQAANYYFYANMIFLLPAGLLLDRISTRLLILTSMILCVAGTVGISPLTQSRLGQAKPFSHGYWWILLFIKLS